MSRRQSPGRPYLRSPNKDGGSQAKDEEQQQSKFFKKTFVCSEAAIKLEDNDPYTQQRVVRLSLQPFSGDCSNTFDQMHRFHSNTLIPRFNESQHMSEERDQPLNSSSQTKSRLNWNLKSLSRKVKELVQDIEETSYKSIAEQLVGSLQRERGSINQQEQNKENQNLKRRIYDSINVMVSLGMLQRNGKQISKGRGFNTAKSSTNADILDKLAEKKQQLIVKRRFFKDHTNKYLNLQALVARNKTLNFPQEEKAFHFPLVAAQTQMVENGESVLMNMNNMGEEFRILSKNPILVLGDLDLLLKLKHIDRKPQTSDNAQL